MWKTVGCLLSSDPSVRLRNLFSWEQKWGFVALACRSVFPFELHCERELSIPDGPCCLSPGQPRGLLHGPASRTHQAAIDRIRLEERCYDVACSQHAHTIVYTSILINSFAALLAAFCCCVQWLVFFSSLSASCPPFSLCELNTNCGFVRRQHRLFFLS